MRGLTYKDAGHSRRKHTIKNICIIEKNYCIEDCITVIKTLLGLNKDLRVFLHNYTKLKITQNDLMDERVTVGEKESIEYILRTLDYLISTTKSRLETFDSNNVSSLYDYNKKNKDFPLDRYLYVIVVPGETDENVYKDYIAKLLEYNKSNSKDTGIHLMLVSEHAGMIPHIIYNACNLMMTNLILK